MWLSSVKKTLIVLTFGLAVLCASCAGGQPTSFYSKFSVRELVERNQKATGFTCDKPTGGGDDAGMVSGYGGYGGGGFGRVKFSANRGDSLACVVKPDQTVDEDLLLAELKRDTETVLKANGMKIVESGSARPASFYFTYTARNVSGRIQVSGTRIGNQYYNLHAELAENGN
jgi:hypothetical protein